MTENANTETTPVVDLTDSKGVALERGMRVKIAGLDATATIIRLHAKSRRAVLATDDGWTGMKVTSKLTANVNTKTKAPTFDRKFLDGKRPELKGV